MKAVIAKQLVLESNLLEDQAVLLDGHRIAAILPKSELDRTALEAEPIDADILMPGFIDIHIHGSAGADVMDANPEALQRIKNSLMTTGTTSFLGTTMTMAFETILSALEVIRAGMQQREFGAKLLGAHLEGPFINPQAKGAHLEAFIKLPDLEAIKTYQDVIRLITIAPETDPDGHFIQAARQMGIGISLGHSACSYACANQAIAFGANSITHLFNAMTGLHHRDPGLVGAALLSDVYTELIADNVHVHPDLYELIYKLKGSERMILITDAMKGQCMKQGKYDLGGQPVVVGAHDARLENGTLAGSILTQDKALKHIMKTNGIDLVKASHMLSGNPANLLNLFQIGMIREGYAADLVLLNNDLNVIHTIIDGECRYSSSQI